MRSVQSLHLYHKTQEGLAVNTYRDIFEHGFYRFTGHKKAAATHHFSMDTDLITEELVNIERAGKAMIDHLARMEDKPAMFISYQTLFAKGWAGLALRSEEDFTKMNRTSRQVGTVLTEEIEDGAKDAKSPIPNLTRVIMTGMGDILWRATTACEFHDMVPPAVGHLPIALLGLSNVNHLCQSAPWGPLALRDTFYRPKDPPKTYTFHYTGLEHLPADELGMPIVIGAVNRFIFPQGWVTPLSGSTPEDHLQRIRMLNSSVLDILERKLGTEDTLIGIDDHNHKTSIRDDETESTTIELYNLVKNPRSCTTLEEARRWRLLVKWENRLLDQWLQGWRWKGKIEVISGSPPPCSACGL